MLSKATTSDPFNFPNTNSKEANRNKKENNICYSNLKVAPVSSSSTTSFDSCVNGIKSSSKIVPSSMANFGNNTSVSKKTVSLGCQTNIGKEVVVELAVYHGDTKVVSKSFEFPNSISTDKTMPSGKAFEIYYKIVNEKMLQVWGVETNPDGNNNVDNETEQMLRNIDHVKVQTEHILENLHCEAEKERLQALLYWTKAQTDKCKAIIMKKYDEIWKMLDKVTVEALNEVVAKEKELVDLIETASEREINVTDYNDILDNIN